MSYSLKTKDADPMLAPPYVFGFCLESKQWCKFFVDSLREAEWKNDALESLVLPPQRKNVIRALVTAHQDHGVASEGSLLKKATNRNSRSVKSSTTPEARNEAQAKGKGLIVLLHGDPGSGKTLTAELMAEHTHRPLLNISTGELGSWEYRVSFELRRLLTFASIWKAIVLIDEADVFLESRKSGTTESLAQNSLVAVFLRQLEYFSGIIFMTSNRVEVFDAAVKSRIHLALKYETPDESIRRSMWRNKLGSATADLGLDAVIDKVSLAGMNGREISNAVNTARTLASDEGVKLAPEHIQAVVDLWSDFSVTLKGTFAS